MRLILLIGTVLLVSCLACGAACSNYEAQIEMKSGGTKTLQAVCVLNKAGLIVFKLTDGREVEFDFGKIKELQMAGITLDNEECRRSYVKVHIVLKNGKELEGQTRDPLGYCAQEDFENPVVVIGADAELGGAETKIRFQDVKSIAIGGRHKQ
jgi:hypothetical protein